ncbi:1-acylglycerol-3-phosphate O-acyltransferase, partial [Linderina pennispora]
MAAAHNILDTLLFYTQVLLFLLSITVASLAGILSYPLLRLIRRKPTTNWAGARALHFLSRHLLAIAVSIEGAENLAWAKETPCILVANHQNLLDTVWLAAMFPRKTVIVANSFIAQLPLLGWFMRLGGNLFVTQGDKNSIKSLFEGSLEYLERERTSIMMFPEGKRNPSETGTLLEFKKGAFYLAYCTHAPIIPV